MWCKGKAIVACLALCQPIMTFCNRYAHGLVFVMRCYGLVSTNMPTSFRPTSPAVEYLTTGCFLTMEFVVYDSICDKPALVNVNKYSTP